MGNLDSEETPRFKGRRMTKMTSCNVKFAASSLTLFGCFLDCVTTLIAICCYNLVEANPLYYYSPVLFIGSKIAINIVFSALPYILPECLSLTAVTANLILATSQLVCGVHNIMEILLI